jgi:hypothetical protein
MADLNNEIRPTGIPETPDFSNPDVLKNAEQVVEITPQQEGEPASLPEAQAEKAELISHSAVGEAVHTVPAPELQSEPLESLEQTPEVKVLEGLLNHGVNRDEIHDQYEATLDLPGSKTN